MKKDISTRQDIELLVNEFYNKVNQSAVLGYIFNDIAKVHWETHLPKMYSFWASVLLGEHSFTGNPMQIHVGLGRITSMTEIEFSEWISLFDATINEHFEGEIAHHAKIRAMNIARLMLANIQRDQEQQAL
jgi:hemoglobin